MLRQEQRGKGQLSRLVQSHQHQTVHLQQHDIITLLSCLLLISPLVVRTSDVLAVEEEEEEECHKPV